MCALLQAKGKVVSQLVGLIEVILYSMLSFRNHYYGEVIIYIAIMLPLYCMGIYSWITHKKEESDTVKQNTIAKKEGIFLGIGNAILFVILYFILKYFNTSQLVVSTFSMVTSLTATYLIMKRSKYSFLFYLLNDIVLLILWGTPIVIHQDYTLIPIALEPLILLVSDTYGWKNWNKEI